MQYDKVLEVEKQFERQYPDLLSPQYGGLEIGYGWCRIVGSMLELIKHHDEHILRTKGKEYVGTEYFPVIVDQIKQKFGELRFYYNGGDDYIDGVVAMGEYLSRLTCEVCGDSGTLRTNGWLRTLCDKHNSEINNV